MKVFVPVISLILAMCLPCRASITYGVSIDTRSLPQGNYQAAFFLTDEMENSSPVKTPDSFAIDGDVWTDDSHFYAAQPVIDFAPPIPLNFYLTLAGSPGSSDYFFLSIRTPDGGMLDAPDGSQWLAWAKMDIDSPTLNLDLPTDAGIIAPSVPEPLPAMLMLIGIAIVLFGRRRCCR